MSGIEAADEFLICTIRTAVVRVTHTSKLVRKPSDSPSETSSSYCDSPHYKNQFEKFSSGGAGQEDDLNNGKENKCVDPGADYVFMRGNFQHLDTARGTKLGQRIGVVMETLFGLPRLLVLGCTWCSQIIQISYHHSLVSL